MFRLPQTLPTLRGSVKRKLPIAFRKHSVLRVPTAHGDVVYGQTVHPQEAVEPPEDKQDILNMLIQPQTFGQGLFDYSCHGNNWQISDKVIGHQSPINISPKENTEFEPQFNVNFRYKSAEQLKLENILWTVRLQGGDLGGIEVTDLNGKGPYIYKVNHMHMHGPAEHHIDDKQYDLEVHIVHELVGGPADYKEYHETLAVIGFLFQVDSYSHPFIEKLRPKDFGTIDQINFNELFESLDDQSAAATPGNISTQDDNSRRFYHYKGSLTNPPCADVVNWIIYKKVLPITQEHLHAFKTVWMTNLGYGNYRECQPLCNRRVVRNFERVEEDDHIHSEACLGHGHTHTHDHSHNHHHHSEPVLAVHHP